METLPQKPDAFQGKKENSLGQAKLLCHVTFCFSGTLKTQNCVGNLEHTDELG